MCPQPAPRLPPTALASREPTQPEGMCSATLSGNKPAAAERPRGPVRGTARAGLSLSSGTEGGWGEHAQGPGAICSSPAQVPVGRGPARAGSSTTGHGHGHGAVAGLSPMELELIGGDEAGLGIPPSPARGTSRRNGDGTGLHADTVTSLLPPACPLGPCLTEGSPPGPCSGEYRHFTLNIKRRIAFVTYRSQRGVSVDSKRGKGAQGRGGGSWRGGRGAVSTR